MDRKKRGTRIRGIRSIRGFSKGFRRLWGVVVSSSSAAAGFNVAVTFNAVDCVEVGGHSCEDGVCGRGVQRIYKIVCV